MVSEAHAQGFCRRAQPRRKRPRRSGPDLLRELRMRRRPQLHRLLQPRARNRLRPAINEGRFRKAQASVLGHRSKTAGGWRPADDLPQSRGNLPVSPGERGHGDGQQHLQRLAYGRCLARPIGTAAMHYRRPRESGGPGELMKPLPWIPACAGMTRKEWRIMERPNDVDPSELYGTSWAPPCFTARHNGIRTKARRGFEDPSPGQPGEHVDP